MTEDRKTLCEQYVNLKQKRDMLKDDAAAMYHVMKGIESKILEDMEEEDMSLFRDSELGKTFYQITETNVKMTDKQAYYDWLSENGMAESIINAISAQNQKSLVKEQIEKTGKDIPGVEVSYHTKLGMRKTK